MDPVVISDVVLNQRHDLLTIDCVLAEHASAEGAQYDSQGQAPNNVRRVAPGNKEEFELSTESAKYQHRLFRSFSASLSLLCRTRGDTPHVVRRLPWLSYFAPSALRAPWLRIPRVFGAGAHLAFHIRALVIIQRTCLRCL